MDPDNLVQKESPEAHCAQSGSPTSSQSIERPSSPPARTVSEGYFNRKRVGSSPFFGAYRQRHPTVSSGVSPKRVKFGPTSPETPVPSNPQTQTVEVVFQLCSPSPESDSSTPGPKKCFIRPDNWWQKDRPPLPAKSPRRPSDPFSKPIVESSSNPREKAQVFEPEEEAALRTELTPPPLCINKAQLTPSPLQVKQAKKYSDCEVPPYPTVLTQDEYQTAVESLEVDYPPLNRDYIHQRLLSSDSLSSDFPSSPPSKTFEAEDYLVDTEKRRHRRQTLEILTSSPEPDPEQETLSGTSLHTKKSSDTLPTMNLLRPESAAVMTAHRREAVRLAKAQETAVVEKCKRNNQEPPGYTFDELIGKGSFGRVYKGRQNSSSKIVAIKVIDIDEADFHAYGEQKDEQIKDFNREIRILRQAQDSGAENLNKMIEALPVHSQLWLICEYCPGGSVKTLMRATNDRLMERYIVVVARELAKALKGLHEAGIMHRDVKAANVLIHEEGHLELCDFGVATVLDTGTDKRRTFIGTLHWMPPELWSEKPEYSDEVDVWEYGCTIYECAMGRPPNSDLRERQQLKSRMRRLKQSISLPENEHFSDGLRSLVSYTLSPDVATRPSMKDVLQHDYLADTEDSHPTHILAELVRQYYSWVTQGGHRVSLFMPGGAAAPAMEDPDTEIQPSDEWNFSMTQDFERRVSAILEIPDLSDLSSPELKGDQTPKASQIEGSPPKPMTAVQKANFEARVVRGADLSNLFDQAKPAYEYKTKTDFVPIPEPRRISDLPFRAMAEDRPSSIASNVIDLGDFDESDYVAAAPKTDGNIQTAYAGSPQRGETFRLADPATLRQKRADSKGPRDPSAQNLTARRTSSADDVSSLPTSTAAHDFAMSQQDWTLKPKIKEPELQEAAEITSSRPGHATMDWSFAKAMSDVVIADQPSTTSEDEDSGPGDPIPIEDKMKKHATLEWSFSNAMAEANAAAVAAIPESEASHPPRSARPHGLLRQMTMPVTSGDFREVDEPYRPPTALSEAYSESSQSSADVDPFGLEQRQDYPGPASLDEMGMGAYYANRGRLLPGEQTLPYNAAVGGPGPFPLGRPPRIGEDGFPGPAQAQIPAGARSRSNHGNGVGSGSSSSGISRQVVEVPEATPPSLSSLSFNATNEQLEAELTRMLEGMQGTLRAASQVVQSRRRRGRSGRPSSGEYDDDD